MRLTAIMRIKMPNGHIFKGKHRLVKRIDNKSIKELQWDYEIEEQNMLYLRYPYLTLEQSHGHMKTLRPEKSRIDWESEKIQKFSKRVTLEDRLMHLKVKDAWD